MADLDVQPKKNNSWWLWILLLLIALALLFFFLRGCNNKNVNQAATDSTAANVDTKTKVLAATTPADQPDFNSPKASYDEIKDTSIDVRGNNNYTIYGLGEDILFDKDQSTLKSSAEGRLKMIAASLNKRFKGATLSVYGHTDSTGTATHNKQLGAQRAEAVRIWLVKNENLPDRSIVVYSLGEISPVASNATEKGRQENRSVSIVARPAKTSGNQ